MPNRLCLPVGLGASPSARPVTHDYPLPMPDRWEDRATCADLSVDASMAIFFPSENSKDRDAESTKFDRAKAICAQCPVIVECLDAHIDERWGCFAGTSPRERRAIRTARRRLRRAG